jgi:hydroxypyruvate isomerase
MKQSFAWWCFGPRVDSAETLFRAAADIGYYGVEMADPKHWPLIKDSGLQLITIGGHQSLTDGLNKRENHDRIEREINVNLEQAVKWGIPNLICFSGNRAGLSDDEGAEITAEGLRRVAGAAESAGVTLVLELLNSKVDHPDYQCDHTAWGVKVCGMVGSSHVKLLYDIYHMQIMEGDLIRTIETHHAAFGHYHTAGNPGRRDLDDRQEIFYPAVMQSIKATGYTGCIGQEFIPKGDPIVALQQAFRVCQPVEL